MTTYLGEKAVGIGTVKGNINVGKVITDEKTILGDGFLEPLSVNTLLFATSESVAGSAEAIRTEFNNKLKVVDSAIDGQADAIAKTRNDFEVADQEIRADMNAEDSRLQTQITSQAAQITTNKNDLDELGDDVAEIQAKIPQSASGSNPLITKQQLLDEEMDIRSDLIDIQGELQTQITAQAAEIAGKQDELTAGEGIKIENNVISATGGGGSGSANVIHDSTLTGLGTTTSPLGLSEAVKDEIADKAPKETVETLTTAVNDLYTDVSEIRTMIGNIETALSEI